MAESSQKDDGIVDKVSKIPNYSLKLRDSTKILDKIQKNDPESSRRTQLTEPNLINLLNKFFLMAELSQKNLMSTL